MRYLIAVLLVSFGVMHALTLAEAIEIGLSNSPTMKVAEENLNQAKWDYYQANFDLLPSASVNGAMVWYEPTQNTMAGTLSDAKSYGIQAAIPLFIGGKVWQNSRIKKAAYDIAKDTFTNEKMTLIADIESKFFLALETKQMNEIAEKEYKNAVTHEEITEIRHRNGTVTEAELLRMKSLTAQRKVRSMQTQTNYLTALIDLRTTLSIKENITPEDLDNSAFEQSAFDVADWDIEKIEVFLQDITDSSLENNLAVRISERAMKIQKKALVIAGGNFLPTITLSGQRNWQMSNLEDEFSESGQIMLSASMPIFPIGNNVSNYLRARSAVRKNENDFISLQNNISLTIRSVALAWISAVQTTESVRLSLEYAENSWEQMNQRYQNGVITSTDMLDADVMLSNANFQFISSRFNILRYKTNLKQLLNLTTDEEFANYINSLN